MKPIIYKIEDNESALDEFEKDIRENKSKKIRDIILNYPTVYIHVLKKGKRYNVYVGETNNIIQRTKEHYYDGHDKENWEYNLLNKKFQLYVIGHEHFTKSMTLDIENRLRLYFMSVENVNVVYNQRGNPQNKYYTDHEFDGVFQQVWEKLRKFDSELFPCDSQIKNSAVFKASPLHKLTEEQEEAKRRIVSRVFDVMRKKEDKQLIFVEGDTGCGKTVLNSSLFYEMYLLAEKRKLDLRCCMIVNHKEQVTVYNQITKRLGLKQKYGEIVYKPIRFINQHKTEDPIDVAFVDEAHLLLTHGSQAYSGKNQLQDILDRAKVVVVMFDEHQILTTESYWEYELLHKYRNMAKTAGNYFKLKCQLRIFADEKTVNWIDTFTKKGKIGEIPKDSKGYEIKIFDSSKELRKAIRGKNRKKESRLSRLIATYDWDYDSKKSPEEKKYWEVDTGEWTMPWNYQLYKELDDEKKKETKKLAWSEQAHTINEVGSTFTIHGLDLSYAGVILGQSVTYRNGKIEYNPAANCNKKVTNHRTLSDGTKKKFAEEFIQHEVRVLMTRGVNGLYIYAQDEQLRNALLNAAQLSED